MRILFCLCVIFLCSCCFLGSQRTYALKYSEGKIDLGWLNKIPGVHENINGVDTDEFDMDNHWGKSKEDEDRAKGSEEMQKEDDEKHGKSISTQIIEGLLDRIF